MPKINLNESGTAALVDLLTAELSINEAQHSTLDLILQVAKREACFDGDSLIRYGKRAVQLDSTDCGPDCTDCGPGCTDCGPDCNDCGPDCTDCGPDCTDCGPGCTDCGPGCTDCGPQ